MNLLPDGYPAQMAFRHIWFAEDTNEALRNIPRYESGLPYALDMALAHLTSAELSSVQFHDVERMCAAWIIRHALAHLGLELDEGSLPPDLPAFEFHAWLIFGDCMNAIVKDAPSGAFGGNQ